MWVVVDGKRVQESAIIGTGIVEYSAWEPSALVGRHSSITTIDSEWYGRIGTRWLPPDLERLPAWSDERLRTVGQWHERQYQEAYDLIIQAFPEAAEGRRSMGTITVVIKAHSPSGSSGGEKPWLPFPDPLGVLERATEDAPVQLRDPLRHIRNIFAEGKRDMPRVRITRPSDAWFKLGQVVSKEEFERAVAWVRERGGEVPLGQVLEVGGEHKLTRDDVRVELWEERDRLHIGIQVEETGEYIVSWWNDEARQMFVDGFFKRGRGLEESVLTYAEEVGLLAR